MKLTREEVLKSAIKRLMNWRDGGGQNALESAETRANTTFVVVGEKTDAQIVDAVNSAHARGRIALTFFNLEGFEKPTDVARSFTRALLAQRQDSDKDAGK